ncbi:PDC sensor domain-containing protein [Robertmurraya andreesenii]|uniref:Methyl-accepting chemotaxis protein n=1 Tax=Anoxybacillus andreesenii TaxID=1325932 RepID=A0ABT9V863_9BACL|nr:hypothetical protein [Robertmurraya andreesenii]MDQ0157150.1 hypothetical protein [Robertmurraya andreesenii]
MNSIKTKLLVVIIPIICIGLVVVSYLNHNKAKEFLEADFRDISYAELEKTQQGLDDALKVQIEKLKGFSFSSDLLSQDPAQQKQFIARIAAELPEYSLVYVADKNGKAMTSADADADVSDRDYFQSIMSGSEWEISDPLISKVDNTAVIVFCSCTEGYQRSDVRNARGHFSN